MSNNLGVSCVELNEINYTTHWAKHSNDSPLAVNALPIPPFVVFTNWTVRYGNESILYYKYCGPFILLLKSFAEYMNREYVLKLNLY